MISGLQLAAAGIDLSGLPNFVSGIVTGALTMVLMVMIARWQRVFELRDRAADRAVEEALRQERGAHEAKVARREVWRADYNAIHGLLESCEELAYHVRHDGPLTQAGFEAQNVASLRMKVERLAERGVPGLREPLANLANSLDLLVQCAAIESASMTVPTHGPVLGRNLHEMQRTAILQDRAEHVLTERITVAWAVLRTEWGSQI